MNYKSAVLRIWYTFNGKAKSFPQGKIYINAARKWIYLQDMTSNTLWVKFNGYSIAEQILDAFSKAKIHPQIIYREKHKGQLLYTTVSNFKKKGIKVSYGGHQQYVLCMNYWEMKQRSIEDEPFNLPVVDVDKWLKGETRITWNNDGTFDFGQV